MDAAPAYHAIFVGLTTGVLAFSFLLVTFRFWVCPGGEVSQAVRHAADLGSLWSAGIGTALLAMATLTGLMTRPLPALFNSPITKNKMLLTALALVCWAGFVAVRAKTGEGVWTRRGLPGHSAWVLALAGFLYMITVNSIGGDLAGIPSGYEQFARAAGYRTRWALYYPTFFNVLLLVAGHAVLIGALLHRRARKRAG